MSRKIKILLHYIELLRQSGATVSLLELLDRAGGGLTCLTILSNSCNLRCAKAIRKWCSGPSIGVTGPAGFSTPYYLVSSFQKKKRVMFILVVRDLNKSKSFYLDIPVLINTGNTAGLPVYIEINKGYNGLKNILESELQ